MQRLAGDVARLFRGEVGDSSADVRTFAHAPHRDRGVASRGERGSKGSAQSDSFERGPGVNSKETGDAAEDRALAHLRERGLCLVRRNYRTPGRGGGEIDLIMRGSDGTLVFVEVRVRQDAQHGGAGASIGAAKRRRILFAAQCFLMQWSSPPPCRFDAVLIDGQRLQWVRAAFDMDG